MKYALSVTCPLKRCQMQGCGQGSGAARGNAYAVTHGHSTAEAKAFKQTVRQLIKDAILLGKELHTN
jgi:hypothetical protein